MDVSKFIPKQVHVPYLGALFDLVCKAFALIGGFNFIMLTRNMYYDANDPLWKTVFGSYIMFMLAVTAVGAIALVMLYIFLVPSSNSYAQRQAVIEGRSPMFEKLCEMDERLKKIEGKV